jgi:large subunit ribosomal protein L7/L12
MTKIETLLEELKTLTLLEATELVANIEKFFKVDSTSNPISSIQMLPVKPVEEIEEKTEFDLILLEVPADKKIAILKVVRTLSGLGLKEAKELVESAPKLVKEAMSKDMITLAKKQLEEAGAKVDIK